MKAPREVQAIIQSRLIACVASLNPARPGDCLSLPAATEVIRESRTRALVYHAPCRHTSFADVASFRWSFLDLIDCLPDISGYVMVANTSRARNAREAVLAALAGRDAFEYLPHDPEQLAPVIKLEVLDDDLRAEDLAVLKATEILTSTHSLVVLPLISPKVESLRVCEELGIPLVRILTGRIGTMTGMKRPKTVARLAHESSVPLFFEGGLGNPQQVRQALHLGAQGVLLNTAFRHSQSPGALARAVRLAIDAYFHPGVAAEQMA